MRASPQLQRSGSRADSRGAAVIEGSARRIVYALIAALTLYLIGRNLIGPIVGFLYREPASSGLLPVPESPLSAASASGDAAKVEALLKTRPFLNTQRNLASALEISARKGNRDVVRLLLKCGADPNRYQYDSPLNNAIIRMPELVPDFLAHGAKVNEERDSGTELCPLSLAILHRNLPLARQLMRRGASVNPRHPKTKWYIQWWHYSRYKLAPAPITPLATAVCYAPEFVPTLRGAGAKLGLDKPAVLIGIAYINRPDVISTLVDLGADVNVDVNGETPLTQAVRSSPKAVPILLEHGARPDVLTTLQQSPLIEAALQGDADSVRQLLAHGAGVNFRAKRGHTPLWYAVRHHRPDIMALLEEAGGRNE